MAYNSCYDRLTGCRSSGGLDGDISIGQNGNVTISNLNISNVQNFTQVQNSGSGSPALEYVISGKDAVEGLARYQMLVAGNDPDTDNYVKNYTNIQEEEEALPEDQRILTNTYRKTFGVIDFVENTSGLGRFYSSNGFVAPFFAAVSDKRKKSDIQKIDSALEKVSRLTGYKYVLQSGKKNTTSAGVLAQDVQEVLPEAVVKESHTSSLAVNYNALIPLLIESIKELNTQQKNLKSS